MNVPGQGGVVRGGRSGDEKCHELALLFNHKVMLISESLVIRVSFLTEKLLLTGNKLLLNFLLGHDESLLLSHGCQKIQLGHVLPGLGGASGRKQDIGRG